VSDRRKDGLDRQLLIQIFDVPTTSSKGDEEGSSEGDSREISSLDIQKEVLQKTPQKDEKLGVREVINCFEAHNIFRYHRK
jgi:hypothetical protein